MICGQGLGRCIQYITKTFKHSGGDVGTKDMVFYPPEAVDTDTDQFGKRLLGELMLFA
jgi:hypothetical protein